MGFCRYNLSDEVPNPRIAQIMQLYMSVAAGSSENQADVYQTARRHFTVTKNSVKWTFAITIRVRGYLGFHSAQSGNRCLELIQFTLNTAGYNCTLDLQRILSTARFDMWIVRTLTVIITAHERLSAFLHGPRQSGHASGILKYTQSFKTSVTLCLDVGPLNSASRGNRLQNRPWIFVFKIVTPLLILFGWWRHGRWDERGMWQAEKKRKS